jgi:hypothetical protein
VKKISRISASSGFGASYQILSTTILPINTMRELKSISILLKPITISLQTVKRMSKAMLNNKKRPLAAIRAKCIDCSGGSLKAVKLCPLTDCFLSPLRMGHGRQKNLKIIRAFCLYCCKNEKKEVRICPNCSCALWEYRFGHNYRKPHFDKNSAINGGILEPITQGQGVEEGLMEKVGV